MYRTKSFTLSRRAFLKGSVAGLASLPSFRQPTSEAKERSKKAKVVLFKTQDRSQGVREVLKMADFPPVKGKKILIKPNFNTSDPTPGSTHNDTLKQLVIELKERGAAKITVGERSGPPPTQRVMEEKGIFELSEELGFEVLNFEELGEEGWISFNPEGNHWDNGFKIARPVAEAEYVVSTCCLKTHQYGGVFTMSLKLAVGTTPKSLMRELHSKRNTDMRKMIAEINLGYTPKLVVLDGVEAFVDGGPATGERRSPGIFLAGGDRVALDAAGLAILKDLGSNEAIMGKKIFEQEQIQHAAELGLGVKSPEEIEFSTPDEESRSYAEKLKSILAQG